MDCRLSSDGRVLETRMGAEGGLYRWGKSRSNKSNCWIELKVPHITCTTSSPAYYNEYSNVVPLLCIADATEVGCRTGVKISGRGDWTKNKKIIKQLSEFWSKDKGVGPRSVQVSDLLAMVYILLYHGTWADRRCQCVDNGTAHDMAQCQVQILHCVTIMVLP